MFTIIGRAAPPPAPTQHPMLGHLNRGGVVRARAGFLPPESYLPDYGAPLARMDGAAQAEMFEQAIADLKRGDLTGDVNQIAASLGATLESLHAEVRRGITSDTANLPIRENLEAPARVLIPMMTPFRNKVPRIPGAGLAYAWRQLTSLGGGWGSAYDQPGGGNSAIRSFFEQSGAPAEHTSTYAAKSAAYKLMGTYGNITGFAMASGANYMPQRATERRNSILNLALNEENAMINGDSASTAAPWGDGSNALAYDGVLNLTTTANGTPSAQIQTGVGPLTMAHIDAQLRRLWTAGAQRPYLLVNGQEALSFVHLAEGSGTIIRYQVTEPKGTIGFFVGGIMHPMDGTTVPIITSRFMPAGTIWFGSEALPDGSPTLEMSVLPQVELPQLAPDEQVQGYVAQDLAPSISAPQVYGWIVTCYEVLALKSALHVAKSSGLTAV